MAVNINNLIVAVNPDIFCKSEEEKDGKKVNLISKVKKIVEKEGFLKAAESAKLKDSDYINFEDISKVNAAKRKGLDSPIERHTLIYDSFGEGLEPLYFWLFDKMNEEYKKVDKLVDNFVSSPGSNQFSEMGMKMTKMQEEASKMLGAANNVIKSILNIIYDLKEFQTRLKVYDLLHSKEKSEQDSAMLSLKQIWMDTVDIKRGNSSIKALALSQQGGFVTLIDAFMAAEDEKLTFKGSEMDLNDRIKRLLQQRLIEFQIWIKESEKELRKRFEIEKIYLKSQVNTVKLYARWAKPYLRAAKALEQNMSPTAALINSFNTTLFEITLMGVGEYKLEDDINKGDLPKSFKTAKKRSYRPVMILEFNFRTVPERTNQGYAFRGRAEVTFTSYALNDDELAIIKQELEKDDLNDVLKLIEGATTESLEKIQLDIDSFLGGDEKDKESKNNEGNEDTNPFSALFSGFFDIFKSKKDDETKESKKEIKEVKSDNYVEKIIRSQALIEARRKCYRVYDLYKKTHKMPSLPGYD